MTEFTVRLARPEDAPVLAGILRNDERKWLTDYDTLTADNIDYYVSKLLQVTVAVVVAHKKSDIPVACWYLEQKFHDLHATLHMLMLPQAFPRLVRANMWPPIADLLFDASGVRKFTVTINETQSFIKRLLRKYNFSHRGTMSRHTRVGGAMKKVFYYEFEKRHLSFLRNHPENFKFKKGCHGSVD